MSLNFGFFFDCKNDSSSSTSTSASSSSEKSLSLLFLLHGVEFCSLEGAAGLERLLEEVGTLEMLRIVSGSMGESCTSKRPKKLRTASCFSPPIESSFFHWKLITSRKRF